MPDGDLVCDACGAPNQVGARSCAYCAAPLPIPVPPAPPVVAPIAGPRRATARVKTYCPQCGELFPAEAGVCPRCPPVLDAVGGATGPYRCPRCKADLEPETVKDAQASRCPACRGLWFDRGGVGQALDLSTQGLPKDDVNAILARVAEPPTKPPPDPSLACARCGKTMDRRQVAPRCHVLVDLCKAHGIWFDSGEFARFSAFVQAGGLEVLRQWDDLGEKEAAHKPGGWRRHNLSESDTYGRRGWSYWT